MGAIFSFLSPFVHVYALPDPFVWRNKEQRRFQNRNKYLIIFSILGLQLTGILTPTQWMILVGLTPPRTETQLLLLYIANNNHKNQTLQIG